MRKSGRHSVPGYLEEGVRIDVIIIGFFQALDLVPHDRLLMKLGGLGRGFEGSCLGKGIPGRSYTKGQSRWAIIQGYQSNLRCAPKGAFWA